MKSEMTIDDCLSKLPKSHKVGRPRVYINNAYRQLAYRIRKRRTEK